MLHSLEGAVYPPTTDEMTGSYLMGGKSLEKGTAL